MNKDFDQKIKRVLEQVSSLSPEFISGDELLNNKRRQHQKRKAFAAGLLPLLLIALFFSVTAFPVFAGQENLTQFLTSRRIAQELQNWDDLNSGNQKDEDLALELGIPVEQVKSLRDSGYGYGEIALMAALSRESGKDIFQIQEMREKGWGWGRISSELGVSNETTFKQMEKHREGLQEKLRKGFWSDSKGENDLSEPGNQPEQKGKEKPSTHGNANQPPKNSDHGKKGKVQSP